MLFFVCENLQTLAFRVALFADGAAMFVGVHVFWVGLVVREEFDVRVWIFADDRHIRLEEELSDNGIVDVGFVTFACVGRFAALACETLFALDGAEFACVSACVHEFDLCVDALCLFDFGEVCFEVLVCSGGAVELFELEHGFVGGVDVVGCRPDDAWDGRFDGTFDGVHERIARVFVVWAWRAPEGAAFRVCAWCGGHVDVVCGTYSGVDGKFGLDVFVDVDVGVFVAVEVEVEVVCVGRVRMRSVKHALVLLDGHAPDVFARGGGDDARGGGPWGAVGGEETCGEHGVCGDVCGM